MNFTKKLEIFVVAALLFSCGSSFAAEVVSSAIEKKTVDKIVARVNGVNILHSDLKKRRIGKNGEPFTLDELISEELFVQKAIERKMVPTDVEIRKQIVQLKIQNGIGNLTDEEFSKELEQEGFNLREYEFQLGRMLASEKLKRAEFNERVVVTKQDVEKYHNNNPEIIPEQYSIKMCELGAKDVDKNGKLLKKDNFKWDDLGWVVKGDINENLAFVFGMEEGKTSEPVKLSDEYHVVKLEGKKNSRPRTLDERYVDIERILQMQKTQKFENEFEAELKKNSFIVYLD